MSETAPELLVRLRRQGYDVSLTPDEKVLARPPAGLLPDHIRAQITARKTEIVSALHDEEWPGLVQCFRDAVFEMAGQYEARKPYTAVDPHARELVDIWYGVMPQKEDYDNRNHRALRAATTALKLRVADYWQAFDAAHEAAAATAILPLRATMEPAT